ncbi:hypothetical protein HMPREF0476_1485 [Kingella kingae ATCC 23330]|uniref:Uncharacterized protein n=1 Tax=Kingella kingae ATCC 23330 TaxID=887327 RepID=F5S8F2_KINKI|nr:hypothetical protein HMPREF0476_1485 [Kingella kingae ATCC 23330]
MATLYHCNFNQLEYLNAKQSSLHFESTKSAGCFLRYNLAFSIC